MMTAGTYVEPMDTPMGAWHIVSGDWQHPNSHKRVSTGLYSQTDEAAGDGKTHTHRWAHAYFGQADWSNIKFSAEVMVTAVHDEDALYGVAAFCRVPDPEEATPGRVHTGFAIEGQKMEDQKAYLMES